MSQKPPTPWIISKESDKIICTHCDCLGESCTHATSLLWAIKFGELIRDSMTVTEKKACWVNPNVVKEVPHSAVKSIQHMRP